MKTTDYNATPKCPRCGAVYVEGETFSEHVAKCVPNSKSRNVKDEAQRAYDRNLAELIEVLGKKCNLEAEAQKVDDEIGRLVYCLARDRAIFRAGGGS